MKLWHCGMCLVVAFRYLEQREMGSRLIEQHLNTFVERLCAS